MYYIPIDNMYYIAYNCKCKEKGEPLRGDKVMKAEKYFEKNGFIYGVSEKFAFGRWNGYARKFTDLEEAYKWLGTEEYDFRERSLVSKTDVKKSKYEVIE